MKISLELRVSLTPVAIVVDERKTFMDRAIAGEIQDLDTAILDAVDAWHEYQPTISEDLIGENIMTWLGMSWNEYSRWVSYPKELAAIVEDRRNG